MHHKCIQNKIHMIYKHPGFTIQLVIRTIHIGDASGAKLILGACEVSLVAHVQSVVPRDSSPYVRFDHRPFRAVVQPYIGDKFCVF